MNRGVLDPHQFRLTGTDRLSLGSVQIWTRCECDCFYRRYPGQVLVRSALSIVKHGLQSEVYHGPRLHTFSEHFIFVLACRAYAPAPYCI